MIQNIMTALPENSLRDHCTAFSMWFWNSRIRNEDGEPLVCYHATAVDFDAFKRGGIDPALSGHAIWVTPHATNQAAAHNISTKTGYKPGTRVIPVYVKMQKPLYIDDLVSLEWARAVFANGSKEFPHIMDKQWMEDVTRGGEYDGIIFDGVSLGWGPESVEYIVFNPNQLKSAIANNGDYSDDDDDFCK